MSNSIGGELYESVGVEAPILLSYTHKINETPMADLWHRVGSPPWVIHSFLWVYDSKMGASTPTLSYNYPPMYEQ